jgi:hypothetical protein
MHPQPLARAKTHGGVLRFKRDAFYDLLDTLVAMHWNLTNGLHDGADLPQVLTEHVRVADNDLQAAIDSAVT